VRVNDIGVSSKYVRILSRFVTSLLRLLPAEVAHDIGMRSLEAGLTRFLPVTCSPEWLSGMRVTIPGIGALHHPIGLAAGFDKNARAPGGFAAMGLSFIELGTITPRPQPGNPKPRMFRYSSNMAIVNRMGFNSDGAVVVRDRLEALDWDCNSTPLGINVGKNKDTCSEDAINDFLDGLRTFEPYASYFVVNLSSPNTEGLRDLAGPDFLRLMASEVPNLLSRIWVKLDPDMPKQRFQEIVGAMCELGYQGLVLCNTHKVDWPEAGGLSGQPLSSLSNSRLEWAYEVHKGRLFMIASGGILSGLDVIERMIRGASAVQIYSALIYRGPTAVIEIIEELKAEMKLRGIDNLQDIVGCYYKE